MAITKPSNSYEVKRADGTIVYRKNTSSGYIDISKDTGEVAGGRTTSTSGGTKTITPIYSRAAESKLNTALQSGTSGEVVKAGRELVESGGSATITPVKETQPTIINSSNSYQNYFQPAINLNPTLTPTPDQNTLRVKAYNLGQRFQKRFPLTTDIFRFETKTIPNTFKESASRGAVTVGNFGVLAFKQRGLTYGEEQKVSRFTGGAFEVQKSITAGYVGGFVAGKVVSSSRGLSLALSSPSGKALGYAGLGLYGVQTVKDVRASDTPILTGAKAVGGLAGFTGGMRRGLTITPTKLLSNTNSKTSVLEFGKTTTKAKSFGGNIIDNYRGKPTLMSGGEKTSGATLIKVGSGNKAKTYRLLFKEKAISRTVGDNTLSRGTSTINIQEYGNTLRGKFPTGTLKKATFRSETLSIPQSDSTIIRGLATIKVKGTPKITRVSLAKATQTGETTNFKGYNIDAFRGKIIKGSQKLVKGTSTELVTRSVGTDTYSLSKGYTFSKDISSVNKGFKITPFNNMKNVRRNSFISGANDLVYGTKTVTKTTPSVTVADLKSVAQQQYKLDVATSRVSSLQQPKIIPVISNNIRVTTTRPTTTLKTIPTTTTTTKYNILTKVTPTIITNTKSKSFTDTTTKSLSRIGTTSRSGIRLDTQLRQTPIQQTAQRQQTIQRTTLKQITLRSNIGRVPTLNKTFNSPIGSIGRFKQPNFKAQSFKYKNSSSSISKYTPTVEASVFKIKGKTTKRLAKSGLTLRPI